LASSLTSIVCCMCSSNWSAVDMSAFRGMASKMLQGTPATNDRTLQHWSSNRSTPALLPHCITYSYRNQNYLNPRHRSNLSTCPVMVTAKTLPFQAIINSTFSGRLLWAQNQLLQTIPLKT
jgi:hypothetical protein